MSSADAHLHRAFHELTLALLGLFEVHGAAPALVDHAADEIESILRRHLGTPAAEPGARGKLALERLLDELEAGPSSTEPHPPGSARAPTGE